MATRSIIRRCLLWLVTGLPASLYAQGITIGTGTNFIVSGPLKIFINNGSLTNNGGFVPDSSTIIFTGSAPTNQSTIGGAGWLPFNNLTIAKSANDVLLNNATYVANDLHMQSGNLQLNGNNLDLEILGMLSGERSGSQVIGIGGGSISCYTNLSSPVAVNPSNLGIEITSPAYMGGTVLFRGHEQQTLDGSTFSIYRYFDIYPSVNTTGLNAAVKLYYLDDELAGLSKSSLNVWSSPDYGINWNFAGSDGADTINHWVYKTGFDSLGRFTPGPPPGPMSASLNFWGNLAGSQTQLKWALAGSPLADHFELERSGDGHNFNILSEIKANINKEGSDTYHFVDPSPLNGMSYYRLKQFNKGNKFIYSRTIAIKTGVATLYPNPVHGIVTIQLYSGTAKQASLLLYDSKGQLAARKNAECMAGINQLSWDLSGLAAGVYTLSFGNLPVATIGLVIQ